MAHTFTTELKSVALEYTELLQVKLTKSTLQKEIIENPYYPSLLALSDTFSKYNIPNDAYKVDKENFHKLEFNVPFIAYVKIPDAGKDFVLVTSVTEQSVSYVYKDKKSKTVSKNDFLSRYKEIIWLAEPNERSGEIDYKEKLRVEKGNKIINRILVLLIFLTVSYVIFTDIRSLNVISYLIIALLKAIGVITTSLLLVYEIDKTNAFVKNICSIKSKTNCEAVLGSKASKIGFLSWSELGFFYFSSTAIWLLIPETLYAYKASWLAIANTIVVPYILFSIYYQWKIIKQWCPLCLIVQFILGLELIWSFSFALEYKWISIINISLFIKIVICSGLPMILWFVIKPVLIKYRDHDLYMTAFKRLQYNPEIFYSLLKQQPKAPEG